MGSSSTTCTRAFVMNEQSWTRVIFREAVFLWRFPRFHISLPGRHIVRHWLPLVYARKVDQECNFMRRTDSQPAWTNLYRNRSLWLSVTGWADVKLGMRRCSFEMIGAMYLHMTQKTEKKLKTHQKKLRALKATLWKIKISIMRFSP